MTRRDALKGMIAVGAGVAGGVTGFGYLYERHQLAVIEQDIPVAGLAPALSGLRVGLLTDVHRSRWVSDDDVLAAAHRLMQARPDVIVLGGDYVTWGDRSYAGAAAEALGVLSAPHGVFAILGNHDDERAMTTALTAQRIVVLRDARTRLLIGSESLELAGLRFWTRKPPDVAQVLRGSTGTTLLLAHDPRRLTEAAALGVSLVLSGHTHGGQVVLPGLGAVAARKFPVVSGVGRQNRTSLFVSRGVGTVYVPVRINCPPEVAVLTLKPDEPGTRASLPQAVPAATSTTKRRPASRHLPSSTVAIARG